MLVAPTINVAATGIGASRVAVAPCLLEVVIASSRHRVIAIRPSPGGSVVIHDPMTTVGKHLLPANRVGQRPHRSSESLADGG